MRTYFTVTVRVIVDAIRGYDADGPQSAVFSGSATVTAFTPKRALADARRRAYAQAYSTDPLLISTNEYEQVTMWWPGLALPLVRSDE